MPLAYDKQLRRFLTYGFGKVPVGLDVVQVEGRGRVILDHPGKHGILGQVV